MQDIAQLEGLRRKEAREKQRADAVSFLFAGSYKEAKSRMSVLHHDVS